MKKTFFQKTYNFISYLFFFGFTSFILSFALNLLVKLFGNLEISFLRNIIVLIQDKLNLLESYTKQIATILILTAGSLIVIELTHRTISDSILNYFKSVYQTIHLRQFLRQDNPSEPLLTADNQTVTHANPILKVFNQSISKCVVDIRKETVTVLLRLPRTQQAQKVLKEMEEDIKEEIANRYPHYYFSAPNRVGHQLWFIGTRR